MTSPHLILDIESSTTTNQDYLKVLYTSSNMQLSVMSLRPGQDIGWETHDGDQFVRIESGTGIFQLGGPQWETYRDVVNQYNVYDGTAFIIPAHVYHNIINLSVIEPLKLYSLYSPPQHPVGELHHAKPPG